MQETTEFPAPTGGVSLILSFRLNNKTTVVIGSNSLAASRAVSALQADSQVVVFSKGPPCNELKSRAKQGQLLLLDLDSLVAESTNEDDASVLDAYLTTSGPVSLICVTDTLSSSLTRRSKASVAGIYNVCRKHRIPANVTDYPEFCDFSFTSTHRFLNSLTNNPSCLQIGVTTNGQGCRLSGRIRREIVSRLPKEIGAATENVGRLRSHAKGFTTEEECEESMGETTPNKPVPQRTSSETAIERDRRRMQWVAQVSEYWPLSQLAEMSCKDMDDILMSESRMERLIADATNSKPRQTDSHIGSVHQLSLSASRKGRIYLVGSGPGHPSLLTVATQNALRNADVVLADKLVPTAVLELVPQGVEVRIARKFPGNAEAAQKELQEAAVESAKRGLTVVRLKQGDPTVYGRAGEEILYFRSFGFEAIVIPGVTSALAGPMFAGIPVTQRGAADSFVVCTGVGKGGKDVTLPGYDRGRTLVILMGVARLAAVLEVLRSTEISILKRAGSAYPSHVPIAIIERASMLDQRVIYSTLRDAGEALDSVGEQRPPGMIVVGWAVLSLWNKGDMTILEDNAELRDEPRVRVWLDGKPWRIAEGLDDMWTDV